MFIITNLCGIEEKLTSYVSRHLFVTQAMMQDVPINAIGAMLGHSSLKTTEMAEYWAMVQLQVRALFYDSKRMLIMKER